MSNPSGDNLILPALTLWQREMVRFFRQRNRVVGALMTPLLFWVLLGSGLGKSFQATEGRGYLEYFYAGTMLMILLFTAIFSTISIIEDRREGFLQAVLVAPVGRLGLVGGKLLGGATIALIQGTLFLLLAPLVGTSLSVASVCWLVMVMFIVAFALTGLGFVCAWWMNSTQGFHAVMNLFLLPLWFLSGALFPSSGAPTWLQWVMKCNPLSYGFAALRQGLYWQQTQVTALLPSKTLALGISIGFAVAMFAASVAVAQRTTKGDLQ